MHKELEEAQFNTPPPWQKTSPMSCGTGVRESREYLKTEVALSHFFHNPSFFLSAHCFIPSSPMSPDPLGSLLQELLVEKVLLSTYFSGSNRIFSSLIERLNDINLIQAVTILCVGIPFPVPVHVGCVHKPAPFHPVLPSS